VKDLRDRSQNSKMPDHHLETDRLWNNHYGDKRIDIPPLLAAMFRNYPIRYLPFENTDIAPVHPSHFQYPGDNNQKIAAHIWHFPLLLR